MTLILVWKNEDNSKVWIAGDKAVSKKGIICQKRETKIKEYNNIVFGGSGYSSDLQNFKEKISQYKNTITKAKILEAMKLKEEDNNNEVEYNIVGVYKDTNKIFFGGYQRSAETGKENWFYEEIDREDEMIYPRCSGLDHETVWSVWEALGHIKDTRKKIYKTFKIFSKIYCGTISEDITIHEMVL